VLVYGGQRKLDSAMISLRALTMLITREYVASGSQRYEEGRSGSSDSTLRHTSASRTFFFFANSVTRQAMRYEPDLKIPGNN
jgi:hypothetical protein